MVNVFPIRVTSFVNPHLFWIFNVNDEKERSNLHLQLQNAPDKNVKCCINQIVLTKTEDEPEIYKRAVIKDLEVKNHIKIYTCWLLDYGLLIKSRCVYNIPEGLLNIPPFVKQACLNNTVGLHKVFLDGVKYEESLNFSVGAIKMSQEYISSAKHLFFHQESVINDIYCGEIVIVNNQIKSKLTELLTKGDNVSIKEDKFKEYFTENIRCFENNFFEVVKNVVHFPNLKKTPTDSKNSIYSDQLSNVKSNLTKIVLDPTEINEVGVGRGRFRKTLEEKVKQSSRSNVKKRKSSKPSSSDIMYSDLEQPLVDKVDQDYVEKWIEKSKNSKISSLDLPYSDFESVVQKEQIDKSNESNLKQSSVELLQDAKGCIKQSHFESTSCKDIFLYKIRKSYEKTEESLLTTESTTTTLEEDELKQSTSSISDSRFKPEKLINNNAVDENDDLFYHDKRPTIGCTCARCLDWNIKDPSENIDKQQDFITATTSNVNLEKPALLFKTVDDQEEEDEVTEIKNQTSARFYKLQSKTKLENFASPKILIHGPSIPAPAEKVLSVPFDPEIHKSLDRLGFKDVRQVQMYTWPALRRRMHVFMVSGPKSGKTMTYLPAVASYIQERYERYENLPKHELGPIAIVLCRGSEPAEEIYDLFQKVFEKVKWKPSLFLAIPPMDKTRLSQFYKQCDILVATPKSLFWLLHSRIVNLKRLCHFVIEDGDVILEKYSKEMEIIFGVMQNMLEHRLCNYSIQMVVVSEKWNVHLEKLLKNLNYTPTICINNYLEAALYGRVNFEFLFVKEHHKKSQVVDIIQSKISLHKIIILCNTQTEVSDVLEYLQLKSISAVEISLSNTKEEIYEYEASWKNLSAQNFVLLCTDDVFPTILDTTDATLLIHYSLPSSWTCFSNRFRAMIDNLSSPLFFKQMDENLYCKTYIFVDQTCEMQFPRLVQLLQKLNKTLPPKYMDCYYSQIRKEEAKKIEDKIELCKSIKLFGLCGKVKCSKRHILSEKLDLNCFLPERGTVSFTLLHVQEVNMFYVKVLQFSDTKGQLIKKNWEDYDEMEEKLNKIVNLEQDYANDLVVGNVYAVCKDEKLKRCQVLKIMDAINSNKKTKTKQIMVKLLDYGPHIRVNSDSLYNLPEEFQSIVPRAFTLYIGNLVPPDGDEKWSSDCKSKLKKELLAVEYNNERSYFSSQVLLLLGQDLWVKNVHLYENIDTLKTTTTKMNVKKVLKDLKLVEEIEEPMKRLYKMCEEEDIILSEFTVPEQSSVKVFEQEKPNWAFLDGSLNCTEVFLCSVISPDLFFIRIKKFDNLLHMLQKEINAAIQKPFYPENFDVVKDYSYLAKDEKTEEYRRALVRNVEDNTVKVFFVDYGTTADVAVETLKFLDDDYITKLPYQAIECHLYGVEPYACSWQNNATKILCDYGSDGASERIMYTYIYDDNKTGHLTSNLNYGVLLLCYNDKSNPIFINQLLVDCGEAVCSDDKNLNLNVTLPKNANEGDEAFKKEPIEEVKNRDNLYLQDDSGSFCSSDVVVFDEEFFLEQLGFKINRAAKEETKLAICENPDKYLPVIKALPRAKYSTPAVNWYQTKELIYLTILLSSIDQFEMKLVREKFLHFRTTQNGREYRLDLIFYGKLNSNFKSSSGINVKAVFVKQEPAQWPRLECTPSHKQIKYDLAKIDLPEETERKLFLDLDMDDIECDMNEIIIGSDEDYSESDLEESSD